MAVGQPYDYVATVWSFGDRTTINGGVSRYLTATGGTSMASELAVVALHAGTLKNLRWSCGANSLSGVGAGGRITLYVNGVATALEANWSGAATSGSGTPDLIPITAGDRFSMRIQPVGTGNITRPRVSIELELPSAIPWKTKGTGMYYDAGGNVGVGTATPREAFSVNGTIESMSGGVRFPDTTLQTTAFGGISSVIPPGSVIAYAGPATPGGWLLCDGSDVDRVAFAALFDAIGTAHGEGDGTTTFTLPDYRGLFLRGVLGAAAAGIDPDATSRAASSTGGNAGNAVGSKQWDTAARHVHPIGTGGADSFTMAPGGATQRLAHFRADEYNAGPVKYTETATSGHDSLETRPKNAYVHFLIKT